MKKKHIVLLAVILVAVCVIGVIALRRPAASGVSPAVSTEAPAPTAPPSAIEETPAPASEEPEDSGEAEEAEAGEGPEAAPDGSDPDAGDPDGDSGPLEVTDGFVVYMTENEEHSGG